MPTTNTVHGDIDSGTAAFLTGAPKKLLIEGKWKGAVSGQTTRLINPANEAFLAEIAEGDVRDVDDAVRASRAAADDQRWSGLAPSARERILHRIADLLEREAEALAQLETLNNGMTIATTRGLVQYAIDLFRYYAGWPTKLHGLTNPTDPSLVSYTLREPLGVIGAILPWNGSIGASAMKLAPALACGNAVVVKPAEQTPLTVLRLGELLLEAGLPDGVVNIVTGNGRVGAALSSHPLVDGIAFTGSTGTGRKILEAASGTIKRTLLELGGKTPNIIFDDAPMDAALQNALLGFTFMNGQGCALGTRIFVQRGIYDEFVARLVKMADTLSIGNPLDPATFLGPLGYKEQFDRVRNYIRTGQDEGASILTGLKPVSDKGYYVSPTIFSNVDNGMRIAQEEIFGPVAAIMSFTDEEDVIAHANQSIYGLAAAVWTRDLGRAHRLSHALKAGTIWVNMIAQLDLSCPFGGYKQSGLGSELGPPSIDSYSQTKAVLMKI